MINRINIHFLRSSSSSYLRLIKNNFSSKVESSNYKYFNESSRGNYSKLESSDIQFFNRILGKTRILTAEENDLDGYNIDWLKSVKGNSKLVLKPKTTEEVSQIMKFCNQRNLAVCPQAGNTSISGGSVAIFDEIVLSTSLMNGILNFDNLSGVLSCQSGSVLHNLDEFLKERGFTMPLDLGAKESCQIGGNVSTNAGGLRVLRYGSLHGSVLGLEAVLADGTVMDCMSTMKKDNTGYDLKHLFIGSEGTLGIVTKVAIQCPIRPNSGLESYSKVLDTFKRAKKDLGEILSACEYIDSESFECAEENLKLKAPIRGFPYYMIIETAGSNAVHDEEKLNKFLEDSMKNESVKDGTVVSEPSHMKAIWNVRERLAESLLKDGYLYVFDFSIPLQHFEKFVLETRDFLGKDAKRVTGFGHLGDGNLHLNVTSAKYDPELTAKVEPFVYNWVAQHKGSISAEHGLGSKKREFIHHSKSNESIRMMKLMKGLFDPKNILNPYKVLPSE